MKLVAELLRRQDPTQPHTVLTRVIVSLIIVVANLIYAGFFGVIGVIAIYLLFVELQGVALHWAFAPLGIALIFGVKTSYAYLLDYWRNYGH
ncbi:MAG: hypothetical protein AAF351_15425 [Pseudomonadota bacterium]